MLLYHTLLRSLLLANVLLFFSNLISLLQQHASLGKVLALQLGLKQKLRRNKSKPVII